MDITLTKALAPVLRDLETSGLVVPAVLDDDWSDVDGQLTGRLSVPDGYGLGIYVMSGEPVPEQIALVADQVQEWAVEELWTAGQPTNWPPCPEHPRTHPLAPTVHGGAAEWMCPKTELVVSEIGWLPGPRSRERIPARSRRAGRSRPKKQDPGARPDPVG